ncbi:hypothetical protein [Evansella clarkii]|uniref:hypothetical protein n=1 Tax=Evansella clarkii TaxID=79879 RepID=UPI000996394C|nr:hypothetical protein [Evansella clarkii]
MDQALNLDNVFERVNREFIAKDYILNNHRRFTLPPFLAKFNDKYIEPIIIANVYEVGMLTLQVIFPIEYSKIPKELPVKPLDISFESIDYYKLLKSFKTKDFYEKDTLRNQAVPEIIQRYILHLEKTCQSVKFTNNNFSRATWMLCDLKENQYVNHEEFIKENKNYYVAHVKNAPREYVKALSEERKDEIINQYEVNRKNSRFILSKTGSVLSLGYMDIKEAVDNIIDDAKVDTDTDEEVKEVKANLYKELSLESLIHMYRFYELGVIKYFYYRAIKELYFFMLRD